MHCPDVLPYQLQGGYGARPWLVGWGWGHPGVPYGVTLILDCALDLETSFFQKKTDFLRTWPPVLRGLEGLSQNGFQFPWLGSCLILDFFFFLLIMKETHIWGENSNIIGTYKLESPARDYYYQV